MLPVISAVDIGPLNAVLIRHCQALNRTRRSSSSENHQGRATSFSVLYTCKLNACVSLFISSPLPACALGIGYSAAPPSPPFVPQNFPPSTSCLVLLPPLLSAICTAHILHSTRQAVLCPAARIVGLEPVYGLYAGLAPCFAYAIFGSSRQVAVGPVALVSLLVAHSLKNHADPDSKDPAVKKLHAELAILLSLIVGCIKVGGASQRYCQCSHSSRVCHPGLATR